MVKLRGPAGAGAVSHGGATFGADGAGCYEVPNDLADILRGSYGFVDFVAVEDEDPAGLLAEDLISPTAMKRTRKEMMQFLRSRGIAFPGNISNDRLLELMGIELEEEEAHRAGLRKVVADDATLAADTAASDAEAAAKAAGAAASAPAEQADAPDDPAADKAPAKTDGVAV